MLLIAMTVGALALQQPCMVAVHGTKIDWCQPAKTLAVRQAPMSTETFQTLMTGHVPSWHMIPPHADARAFDPRLYEVQL